MASVCPVSSVTPVTVSSYDVPSIRNTTGKVTLRFPKLCTKACGRDGTARINRVDWRQYRGDADVVPGWFYHGHAVFCPVICRAVVAVSSVEQVTAKVPSGHAEKDENWTVSRTPGSWLSTCTVSA